MGLDKRRALRARPTRFLSPPVWAVQRRGAALLCLALLLACITLAPAAGAHAIVVASFPARNASVTVGDLTLRLEFNSRIDIQRSRVTLHGPDGREFTVHLESGGKPAELVGQARLTVAGTWTLRWQVLAIDGHITRGDIVFVATTTR